MSGPDLEFLLEIGCEEIPARMLAGASEDLTARLLGMLDVAGLAHGPATSYATPRRLAALVPRVAARQADRDEEVLGPPAKAGLGPDGKPTKAAIGFAQKMGIDPGALGTVSTSKGDYLAVRRRVAGRSASEILAEAIPRAVAAMGFPKMMRWGDGTRRFVRPVHWVVALLDDQVVSFELFGVASGRESRGHRVLGARSVQLASASGYEQALLAQGVVLGRGARRGALSNKIEALAAQAGTILVEDPSLLEEVADLVEYPGAVLGSFPEAFLDLPREVLVTTLRHHQKAFSTERGKRIANYFLVVADLDQDPEGHIRKGNEWVVVGRLDDARFFFDEDRKTPFEDRRKKLEHVTFHAKAGSYADKSSRTREIALALAGALDSASVSRNERAAGTGEPREPRSGTTGSTSAVTARHEETNAGVDTEVLGRAADLAKCDLTTGLVGEFPELQGIAGGIYIRETMGRDGSLDQVAAAVYDQYRPAGASDPIPATLEGALLGLADRLDTLAVLSTCVGLPTGSKDPYGLRRAAYGAIRIVVERRLPLSLWDDLTLDTMNIARETVTTGEGAADDGQLLEFLRDRFQHWLKEQKGVSYDTVLAVMGARKGERALSEPLPRLAEKALALEAHRALPEFAALVEIHKRCRNILEQAEANAAGGSREATRTEGKAVEASKMDPEEAEAVDTLARQVEAAEREVGRLMLDDEFEGALQALVGLRPALSRFFDHALVMHPDPSVRTARLRLVARTAVMIEEVADLKEISIARDELQRLLGQLETNQDRHRVPDPVRHSAEHMEIESDGCHDDK